MASLFKFLERESAEETQQKLRQEKAIRKMGAESRAQKSYSQQLESTQRTQELIEKAARLNKQKKSPSSFKLAESVAADYAREQEYKKALARIQAQEKARKYAGSFAGRISKRVSKGIAMTRRGGLTAWSYGASMKPSSTSVSPYSRKGVGGGRPRGSYNPLYAKYGGVYGYRKMLAAKLRIQKMEAMRKYAIPPEEQAILSKMRAMQQQKQVYSREASIFPDTTGDVNLNGIFGEIDRATNLVD